LLGYWGLGSAIKTSTILFDDKKLELLKGLPLPTPEDQQCPLDSPQDEETTHQKLHRYFSRKLSGIYIALKCSSKLPTP